MRMKKIYIPWVLILLSTSFVLAEYYAGIDELYISSIFLPVIGAVVLAIVTFYIFNFFLKDKTKTEIFSFVFLILFFSYGAIISLNWNFSLTIGKTNFGRDDLECFLILITLLHIFFKLRNSKRNFIGFKTFLFRVSAIAFVIPLLLVSYSQIRRMVLPPAKSPLVLPKASTSVDKSKLPDIYFIEPEDYAAPSVFKNNFNYDETDFTTYLKNAGFYFADKSTSNYPKTFESLASIFNMEYLDYLSKYSGSSDMTIVNPLIENNNVRKFLKEYGYKYYQMGSWWGPTQFNPLADDNFTLEGDDRQGIDPFLYDLADSTILSPILDKVLPKVAIGDSDDDDRQRIIYQFKKLPQIVTMPGPKFIFAHILAPHGPYVFGSNCQFVTQNINPQETEIKYYVNQTKCINKNLESTINTIISTSKTPPVIILLTDEGAPFLNNELGPGDNWKTATDALIQEKFPDLAAFYLPGVSTKNLYPSITSVNVFREVFNLYFKTNFPILPDKNYIFQDLQHIYDFKDVSDIVNK